MRTPLRTGKLIIGYVGIYHVDNHYHTQADINLIETLASHITAVFDNTDLLQALERYASEQAQLVHLSRISNTLDFNQMIESISKTLRQMLNITTLQIALFNPNNTVLQVYRHISHPNRLHEFTVDAQNIKGLMQRFAIHDTAHSTLPYRYSDAPETDGKAHKNLPSNRRRFDEIKPLLVKPDDHSVIIAPMVVNRKLTGYILLYNCELNDNQLRLLEMATHQIASQIQNARLHLITQSDLSQRLKQLALIGKIAQQISGAHEADEVIQNVIKVARQATRADFASLALVDEVSSEYTVVAEVLDGGETNTHTYQIPSHFGLIGEVMRTGQAVRLNNNQDHFQYESTVGGTFQSALVVPMRHSNNIIGVIDIQSRQANFFTNEQETFINNIAGHAAASLMNAKLLEEQNKQIRALDHLRHLSLTATQLHDYTSLSRLVVHTAKQIFGADNAELFRFDLNTHEFLAISTDATAPHAKLKNYPTPIVVQAINTNSAKVIPDIQTTRYYRNASKPDAIDYRTLLIAPVPLSQDSRLVLLITYSNVREFTDRDHNNLDLLALQVAGHAENLKLNDALRTQNNQMRTILDTARDGMILVSDTGYVLDANMAASDILQIELQDFKNLPLTTALAPVLAARYAIDDPEQLLYKANDFYAKGDGENEAQVFQLQHGSGYKTIEEINTPVRNIQGDFVGRLLILRDITEETQLADFRRQVQNMVLHDLRGPLSSIITSLDLSVTLLSDPEQIRLEEGLGTTLNISLDSANNLLQLVDTLRDIPRLEQGRMLIAPQDIGVMPLVESAHSTLMASIDGAEIDVQYKISDGTSKLYVDKDLIRRVFINLLHNAFKFTPQNGTIIISADDDAPQDYVRVMICDSGPGIPPEMRNQIFEEFKQIKELVPAHGDQGSGVGLTFCKLAVEAHGGRIWVEDDHYLSGACFAFTLPTNEDLLPHQPEMDDLEKSSVT